MSICRHELGVEPQPPAISTLSLRDFFLKSHEHPVPAGPDMFDTDTDN